MTPGIPKENPQTFTKPGVSQDRFTNIPYVGSMGLVDLPYKFNPKNQANVGEYIWIYHTWIQWVLPICEKTWKVNRPCSLVGKWTVYFGDQISQRKGHWLSSFKYMRGIVFLFFVLLRYVWVLNIFSMKHAILSTSSGFGMIQDVYENHPPPKKNELSCVTLNKHQWSPCGEILPSTVVPMANVWSTWRPGISTFGNMKHEGFTPRVVTLRNEGFRYYGIYICTQIYVSRSGCLFQHHLDTRLWKNMVQCFILTAVYFWCFYRGAFVESKNYINVYTSTT